MNQIIALEYESITQKTLKLKSDFTTGTKNENTNKNRYMDILALEDTRVHLPTTTATSSDYINANFVNTDTLSFICTQSPLKRTFKDFWMMIWDQKCKVIVALNRLIENKTVKGDRYWPEDKKLKYDNLSVKLLGILPLKDLNITIRRLRLSYNKEDRELYHIHYEGWPDFGVPDNSLAIRELIRLTQLYQKLNYSSLKGPVVVHCSAGIGRSGSFMSIATIMSDPLFNQLIYDHSQSNPDKEKILSLLSQFKIPDMVLLFRQKRHPGIVQTTQQYEFIYTTLVDEICSPTTVSGGLLKAIQWDSIRIKEKELLSRSGPIEKKNYLQFLADQTTNDFKNMLSSSRNLDKSTGKFDRSFLTKSTPLFTIVDNFNRLIA